MGSRRISPVLRHWARFSQAHSQARGTSPVLPRKYKCIEGGEYVGARKCSQGLGSVYSSRCAHRAPKPGWQNSSSWPCQVFQAPAEDALLEEARALRRSLLLSLPICPHSRTQPLGYPTCCCFVPHASCQSKLRLAGKSTFQDVEAVQSGEGCKDKGHLRPSRYFDRTPTELGDLILGP